MTNTTVKDKFFKYITHGDAFYTGLLTVPLALISDQGLADLTGCTITAAFRFGPESTPVPIAAVIEDGPNRIISANMDPFDTDLALGDGITDKEKNVYLDIQIKNTASGTIITVARYVCKILWQRDEAV